MSVTEDDGEPTSLGSQVAPHLQPLPIGEPNALMRLHQVAYATQAHKDTGRAVDARSLSDIAGFAPTTLHALGVRVSNEVMRKQHDVLVTNVPGPQMPLYAAGERLVASYPVLPLWAGHLLAIGVTSYNGHVYFGLTADRDAIGDLDVLAQCLDDAIEELLDTTVRGARICGSRPGRPPRRPSGRPRKKSAARQEAAARKATGQKRAAVRNLVAGASNGGGTRAARRDPPSSPATKAATTKAARREDSAVQKATATGKAAPAKKAAAKKAPPRDAGQEGGQETRRRRRQRRSRSSPRPATLTSLVFVPLDWADADALRRGPSSVRGPGAPPTEEPGARPRAGADDEEAEYVALQPGRCARRPEPLAATGAAPDVVADHRPGPATAGAA